MLPKSMQFQPTSTFQPINPDVNAQSFDDHEPSVAQPVEFTLLGTGQLPQDDAQGQGSGGGDQSGNGARLPRPVPVPAAASARRSTPATRTTVVEVQVVDHLRPRIGSGLWRSHHAERRPGGKRSHALF